MILSKQSSCILSKEWRFEMKHKCRRIVHWSFILMIGIFILRDVSYSRIKDEGKVEALGHEIRVLNLFNGLELTASQMEFILDCANISSSLREDLKKRKHERENEMNLLLQQIKDHVMNEEEIPVGLSREYHGVASGLKKDIMIIDEKIEELARRVEKNLESHQRFQLEEFIPCIIPPEGQTRIGQAKGNERITRSLDQIREIPGRIYHWRRDLICSRAFNRLKLYTPSGISMDERQMKSRIGDIFDKARRMNDTEYEIQKENLAEEFHALFEIPDRRNDLLKKIERFLLSDAAISVIRSRLHKGAG